MIYFLVSIRLLFFLLLTMAVYVSSKEHGKGCISKQIEAFKSRLRNFKERMEKSVNARKYFIYLVVLTLVIIQFVDYTLLVDYKYYRNIYLFPNAQFFLCWIFTLMLIPLGRGYRFADRLFSTYNRNRKQFGYYALCFFLLLISPFMIICDVAFVILMAMIIYPDMKIEPNPKGRKPLPEEQQMKKAA